MTLPSHVIKNQAFWDRTSDDYQQKHGAQLDWRSPPGWGVWDIPESSLQILGDVAAKDVLEFGCGAAQWSIELSRRGARVVGIDVSQRQLAHARELMREAGVDFPLIHTNAESIPLSSQSFDIIFCDHGAMSFADPYLTIPETSRLLRPGGLLAFNMPTPLLEVCWNEAKDAVDLCLQNNYFELRSSQDAHSVNFQLPYGEWIRLFRRNAFIIEDLVELQAPERATTSYEEYVPKAWARAWPAEHIWKVRRV